MRHIAIIGAGAAGCFAAANMQAAADREIVVFEKSGKPLQKVRISGGGRCNVTHEISDISELLQAYPRGGPFLKKLFYQFDPTKTKQWFADRHVPLKTESDGRVFPISDDSQTIIDCLLKEIRYRNVQLRYHKTLNRIVRKQSGGFLLRFTDGSDYEADQLLIACGGFAKADQFRWLTELGHTFQPPVPSLFTFNTPRHPITALMGVSVPLVGVKIAGTRIAQTGALLVTHWGLSGPAVLRTSAYGARVLSEKNYHFTVLVNWLGAMTPEQLKEQITGLRKSNGSKTVYHKNPFGLPRRLWEFLLGEITIPIQTRWGDLSSVQQNNLLEKLIHHSFEVTGKTTFKEEFVTCGGISLTEIDPRTMQSRLVPNLYFAGEITDIDGITGGFNFQYAWASAAVAALNLS